MHHLLFFIHFKRKQAIVVVVVLRVQLMAYVVSGESEKKGKPLPRRGQVKSNIIGTLVRSFTNTQKRDDKTQGDHRRRLLPTDTSPFSRYN